MRFSLLTLLSATAALAAPSQVSGGENLEARSDGVTHIVKVTENGISPAQLSTNVGDFIWFKFGNGFNSIVEGEYERPCLSYGNGFSSTTVYHSGGGYFNRVFVVDIPDNRPRWYYSGEGSRCKNGHVAVINPPADGSQTLQSYSRRARRAQAVQTHGQRGGVFEDDD